MMKKRLLLTISIALVSVCIAAWKPAPPPKPNFILILTDDQGWTSLSAAMDDRHPGFRSDYYETPNIDRLGNEGMRFNRGYAPAALCTPSRRSIQFGQSPIHTGDVRFPENYQPRKRKWMTIPSLLKSLDSGYKTAHYGKWDLRAGIFPEDLGYDESDGNTGNNNGDVMTDKKTKWTQVYLNKDPKRTASVTSRALNFMQRQVQSDHPFYLQVSYYAPHVDMETTEETYAKYQHKPKGKIHDNPAWAGMLENMDSGVGQILDMVEKLGIDDNTYIIFMSDNGGVPFFPPSSGKHKLDPPSASKKTINYPLRGGKWVLYEGGIRVPFIVKGPGIKAHSYCHTPIVGYDILPTIGDLAGNKQPLPGYLDGASFRSLLENPAAGNVQRKETDLFFHRYEKSYEHSAIISGHYKLIKQWTTSKVELYDLDKDLEEVHDLAAALPDTAAMLERKLMEYLKKEDAEVLDKSLGAKKKKAPAFPGSYPVLHPRYRMWPAPAANTVTAGNAAVLLWPATRTKGMTYDIRLSQDPAFSPSKTIQAQNIPWTIYNPHRVLEAGDWHWQYRPRNGQWSAAQSFRVESAGGTAAPAAGKLLSAIPASHPRVLIDQQSKPAFTRLAAPTEDAAIIIRNADKLLDAPLPAEPVESKNKKGKTAYQAFKLEDTKSKHLGFGLLQDMNLLCQAYILTGQQKYADKGVLLARTASHWDPRGFSGKSDFGTAGCMLGMALAFDTFHDRLTAAERKALLDNIQFRANDFYEHWINDVDAKVLSAHVWQFILHYFFQTAVAVHGELKDADKWLTYAYELWLARAPVLGGSEGGWLEGAVYFTINMETLLDMPAMIKNYTGFDFIRHHPWYLNNPYWMMYSFPAGSSCDGFGDNAERQTAPGKDYLAYADALGKLTGSRAAATYAGKIEQTENIQPADADMLRWFRLRYLLDKNRPAVLPDSAFPSSRLFHDVGIVDMHSNIGDVNNDLMVSMRSSPYGGYGHMLADQNTFNVLYGGQRLFYMSGHKIAMNDPHRLEWYKATIGHNGVLVNDKGQTFDSEGYGWISRFLDGRSLSYAVGDASMAYGGQDKTTLKKFKRHLLFLHPDIVVVYDELEAASPSTWKWLIHSPRKISLDTAKNEFYCALGNAAAASSFFSSQPVKWGLTDTFAVAVDNWVGSRDENGKLYGSDKEWHLTAATQPSEKMRFLAVIQLRTGSQQNNRAANYHFNDKKELVVGNWTIKAQLDASKPAIIEAHRNDGKAAFVSGGKKLETGGGQYTGNTEGSAKLGEQLNGKWSYQEAGDSIPAVVKQITPKTKK